MKIRIPQPRRKEITLIVVLCAVWFLIGWIAHNWLQPSDTILVDQARQALQNEYPANVPANRELTYAAIQGMLDSIKDPYAQLLDPAVGRAYLADFAGDLGVVGLSPQKRDGQIVIDQVFPGQAADIAGLKAGDIISSVDGVEFDATVTEAQAAMLYIAGPVGTTARFVVRRGDKVLSFDVPRQDKTQLAAHLLADGIAYLSLPAFTQNAPEKFRAALQGLLAQQPKALIWDLRDNRGGSTEAAQQILSYFINEGVLFSAELKGGIQQPFNALGGALAANIPLVVLVNNRSYSAAEAAAAAIQERQRGILIGTQTHGKAEIQTTLSLTDGSLLHYSIGKLLSPDGHWVEGRGVTPDIVVSDDRSAQKDPVLDSAVEYIRRNLLR
jgi:carboxyl-terminal processing protease